MEIEVGHDEGDIQCTIVLLKALAKKGEGHHIEVPLAAHLLGEEGWRLAAIKFLDGAKARQQRQERFTITPHAAQVETSERKDASKWAEENERWDWEERKSNEGKLNRELRSHT